MGDKIFIPIKKPEEVCNSCWNSAKVTMAGILIPEHCRSKCRCVYSLVEYVLGIGGFMFVLEQKKIV